MGLPFKLQLKNHFGLNWAIYCQLLQCYVLAQEIFFLGANLVKDIKIFHLRPFGAICDHFEAPYSQKAVKKLIGIKVQDPSFTQQNGL